MPHCPESSLCYCLLVYYTDNSLNQSISKSTSVSLLSPKPKTFHKEWGISFSFFQLGVWDISFSFCLTVEIPSLFHFNLERGESPDRFLFLKRYLQLVREPINPRSLFPIFSCVVLYRIHEDREQIAWVTIESLVVSTLHTVGTQEPFDL